MNEYDDELYHYGVMGMRWGHRKAEYYDKRADINRRKSNKAKTSIGKNFYENLSSTNQNYADRRRDIKNSKGIINKAKAAYGHRNSYRTQNNQSQMNYRQAKNAKTKLFKQMYKVKSMNSKSSSNYHKRIDQSKNLGQRFVNKYIKAWSTEYTKYSGRTTTIGMMFVDAIIPGLGTMKDLDYMRKHKGEFGRVD